MIQRKFRLAGALAAAILALAAAHPAEAAGGRAEARSAGKAPRSAARAAAAPSLRPATTAARRPVAIAPQNRAARAERGPRVAAARPAPRAEGRATIRTAARTAARPARGTERSVASARGGRIQARAAGRREAVRTAERRHAFNLAPRGQVALHGRGGFRNVGLFAAPAAAASLPSSARGWKAGKPARSRAYDAEPRRGGTWHAGIPAADGEQMDCPSGTMAVLARGHADTFRCLPM